MVEIGKYNTLKIIKDLDFGVYLDGGDGMEILLPARYVQKNVKPGDEVEVFIYHGRQADCNDSQPTCSSRRIPVYGSEIS